MSQRAVAERLGISAGTVTTWVRRFGDERHRPGLKIKASVTERIARRDEPIADDPLPAESEGSLALLRRMQRDMLAVAARAQGVGNMSAAQRALGQGAALAPVIARLERLEREGTDMIAVPRADVLAARDRILVRAKAVLRQPMVCACCGKRLMVEWVDRLDAETAARRAAATRADSPAGD